MTQKDYLLQIDSVIANGKFKDKRYRTQSQQFYESGDYILTSYGKCKGIFVPFPM